MRAKKRGRRGRRGGCLRSSFRSAAAGGVLKSEARASGEGPEGREEVGRKNVGGEEAKKRPGFRGANSTDA